MVSLPYKPALKIERHYRLPRVRTINTEGIALEQLREWLLFIGSGDQKSLTVRGKADWSSRLRYLREFDPSVYVIKLYRG